MNKINSKNTSTPSFEYKCHPSRGELNADTSWQGKSLYPYWKIPKNKLLKERTKSLRKAGVLSEVLFWKNFKNKKELGFDIDRQVIIGNYIADFFIQELGLVFEIDGVSHDSRADYDKERDVYMESLGLKVVRILDVDIKKKINYIYEFVLNEIEERKIYLTKNPLN